MSTGCHRRTPKTINKGSKKRGRERRAPFLCDRSRSCRNWKGGTEAAASHPKPVRGRGGMVKTNGLIPKRKTTPEKEVGRGKLMYA